MNFFKRLISPYKLKEIFTPQTVAKLTYISRKILETDLTKYLDLPGKQIIIYGHSGGGKTTLIRNILNSKKINSVKTHCENVTTFNDLLLNAFDQLNKFYINEKYENKNYTISSELKSEYKIISGKINESSSLTEGIKQIRLVPPQLTPQKLAQFLGEINSVWLIEDFHKIKIDEKQRIADVLKIFIDQANDYPLVKIICIGAVGSARELLDLDDNLKNRVAEMFVPLLTDNEIKEIINRGTNFMNTSLSEILTNKIIYYSNNLGSLTHQICYDIFYHNQIFKTRLFKAKISDNDFKVAIESYVRNNSDSFLKIYDKITLEKGGWKILKTFDFKEKEHLSFLEIKDGIRDKSINETELDDLLQKFRSSEYNEIIRYDNISQKYSISSPFFRAFLKMKLALDKSELTAIRNKKQRKKQNEFNLDKQKRKIIVNEKFLSEYYDYLDSYVVRKIEKDHKNNFRIEISDN